MFVPGQVYNRRQDLHGQYGGQRQGGISTPAAYPFILVFTGEAGLAHGYEDGWDLESGTFNYTGEGQTGDMTFRAGNKALANHVEDGKDLHLFEYVATGTVKYVGQMVCTGWHLATAPDTHGNMRQVIKFELTPIENLAASPVQRQLADPPHPREATAGLWSAPLATVRRQATESESEPPTPKERRVTVYNRSQAVRVYVLRRADGSCEGCEQAAPFLTGDGRPYLEPHHIRRLSDGGPDDPRWVVALCPNCHRRVHYGADGEEYNRQLTSTVSTKEAVQA